MNAPANTTHPPTPHRRRRASLLWLLIPGVVLSVPALFVLAVLLMTPAMPTIKQRPFDAEVWRANPTRDSEGMTLGTIRQTMVDDLLKQGLLIGKSRVEVETLLGTPSGAPKGEFEYLLGSERVSLAMDPEVLHIYFENDRVHKAQILSH